MNTEEEIRDMENASGHDEVLESEGRNFVEIQDDNNHDPLQEENNEVLGLVFDTTHEAYTFYNQYALLHGFGVRIHCDHKKRATNEVYRKLYVCNKQGFKRESGNSSNGYKKLRRATRTGCEAMFRIAKGQDGKWFVDYFNDTHNHPLSCTPTKVIKHRSHKENLSMACRSLMSELSRSGLKPAQIKRAVNVMKTPHELDVTAKQCSDILSVERKKYKGKEFYGLIKHFHDKAKIDKNLYFEVELFDDRSPKNIFWADGRSRDSYALFGDVVVFDVTYMTNKFRMPFAPFVGVNHHGQSILFGAGLLENEKEETFIWLLENFLKCMFDKPPSAIITDQDKAMGNAISKVFPSTRHRYCAWHIIKHENEHLRLLRAHNDDFQSSYSQWVKSDTVVEFETRWKMMLGKYDISNSSWLADMYNRRSHWAKAFLKDTFFAGMTTSGRSESIHSFFDGYVNDKTMLNDFVVQYDKAVDSRRAAEEDEDFKTINTTAALFSAYPIEKRAGERYTRKMFEVFKQQWIEAITKLSHETLSKSSNLSRYRVGAVDVDTDKWRIVHFHNSEQFMATCSCAKFETHGILCKHILYVMNKKHVPTLPDRYILPRWTMDARHKRDNATIALEELHSRSEVSPLSLWCIQSNCTKAIEESRDCPNDLKEFNNLVVGFLEKKRRKKEKEVEMSGISGHSGVEGEQAYITSHGTVRDPVGPTITKGRPRTATRIKSFAEVNMNGGEKKKRKCSHCHELGHYVTGCPKNKLEKANSINKM